MATFSLSGSGTHALTTNTTGLQVTITTPSSIGGVGRSNPVAKYDQGLIRFSDGTSYWPPVAILGGPQFIPVPGNASSIGYALLGGAVISVVEVIGGTLFFSAGTQSLETLSDVLIAAIADGQVLSWNAAAGKWENVTPSTGGTSLTYHDDHLVADVVMTNSATDYDILTRSLVAGTWLLLAELEAYNGSFAGSHGIFCKLWNGSTVYKQGVVTQAGVAMVATICFFAVVVLGGTTTVKLTCSDGATGGTHVGAANLGAPFGATDTHLLTIQLA